MFNPERFQGKCAEYLLKLIFKLISAELGRATYSFRGDAIKNDALVQRIAL